MDIKILLSLNTFILFLLSIYFSFMYVKHPQKQVIKLFSYMIFTYFLATFLFILRGIIPDFFSIVLANTFFALGILFLYLSIKSMLNLQAQWNNRYFIPLGTIFLGFCIFTYVHFDTQSRMILHYIFNILYLSTSLWALWHHPSSQFKIFDRATAVLFLSVIFLFLLIKATLIKLKTFYFNDSNFFILISTLILYILVVWSVLAIKFRVLKE